MGERGAGRGAATHSHMLMHSHDPNEAEVARVQTANRSFDRSIVVPALVRASLAPPPPLLLHAAAAACPPSRETRKTFKETKC